MEFTMKISVFWYVTLYCEVDTYRRFGGTFASIIGVNKIIFYTKESASKKCKLSKCCDKVGPRLMYSIIY